MSEITAISKNHDSVNIHKHIENLHNTTTWNKEYYGIELQLPSQRDIFNSLIEDSHVVRMKQNILILVIFYLSMDSQKQLEVIVNVRGLRRGPVYQTIELIIAHSVIFIVKLKVLCEKRSRFLLSVKE